MNNETAQSAPTALVVNDDAQELAAITALLTDGGYTVMSVETGEAALEAARTIRLDIIVSDAEMPEMNGLELCRHLKTDARTNFIPVLLTSEDCGDGEKEIQALEAGADDCFQLPLQPERFPVRVARLIERHRVERHYREIVEQAAETIYTRDMDGRITSINEAGARFYGRPVSELVGMNLSELQNGDAAAGIEEIKEQASDQPLRVARWVKDGRGAARYVEGMLTFMRDAGGRATGVRGVVRDITEIKLADEALAQQAEREALINRITRAVRRSLDPSEVFHTAVEEIGVHLSADRCVLYMLDAEAGLAHNAAEYTATNVLPAERSYDVAGFTNLFEIISREGVLAFDDAATAADESIRAMYEKYLRAIGTRSIMFVAVRVGDEVLGGFTLAVTGGPRHWSESDIALARAVADQTGIAIRQAQLYERAEATRAREALVNRLSAAIRSSLDLPEVLRTATRELGRALGTSRVHLRPYNPANLVSPVMYAYVAPEATPLGDDPVSYADPIGQFLLGEQRMLIVNDSFNYMDGSPPLNSHIRKVAERTHARSEIFCPLVVRGRFRGALCIHQTDRVRAWTKDDIALVETIAAQLATGVAQAELFEIATRARNEWETTFNAMSDGIFIFDNDKRLVRVNRAGAALEDTWPHLLLGRKCCDILRESGEDKSCIVERTIDDGRSVTLELTPARVQRPLLVTVEPVTDGGGSTGAVCTVRDLTELREMEAVARERESLLTNILESARESIFAIDREGRFQWCNSTTTAESGYTPEELKGRHYLEVTYEPDRELVREHFERALGGAPQTYELRYKKRDDSIGYSLVDKAPIITDGRITGVLGIARDITEQKIERERALQSDKLRALGQLASGVAHDFNNALAAILGRTQLLRYVSDDARVTQNLDVIQTAAEDAAATVRRIQAFARQSHAEELELIDAGGALRDAVEITRTHWENQARASGINYEVEIMNDAAREALYVMGAASELREVFVNLIVNAIDAMPQGGRLIIGGVRDGDRVRLSFADEGTGISDEVRERIFEPFFTTKGMAGTGLGLFVSYGIIERFGGAIDVESEAGRGTTFTVVLPAAAPVKASPSERAEQTVSSSLAILVIDDDEFVRETLAELLSMLNHRVRKVESGRHAIALLAEERFDVVFTDLSMPEMDGWEVARAVRRAQSDARIVLITGHGHAATPPPGEAVEVDEILGKPFDFDRIAELLQSFAARSAAMN